MVRSMRLSRHFTRLASVHLLTFGTQAPAAPLLDEVMGLEASNAMGE